ncbi:MULTISPECIES: polysaccharide deacetylase family protein [unclassified Microbacterium]|uniref:polysaccharide deacetylase family protein n=1 Tax=unclassified Microbacterium TaxID=2609290 RepID=UPI0022F022E0|nr:polysaccharide deacetylase family protein [Streptomyces sp. MS2A]
MAAPVPPTRHSSRRPSPAVLKRRRILAAVIALLAVGLVVVLVVTVVHALSGPGATADPKPQASGGATPAPTPESPVEALLATTDDPNACAVSFEGDGIAIDPMLQTQGVLYTGLPIPAREGLVFAGWYATAEDAAAYTPTARVNGSELAACTDRRLTLHGSWMTPEQNAEAATEVPILMYHQFTTRPEGEDNALRGNYAYIGDFEAHMAYIAEQQFYLPTWDELNAFIDGTVYLPPKSVIITDDDADQTWLDLAVPVVTQHQLLTTSFVITEYRTEGSPSPYVIQRSHTHDMHEAGDNGEGRMVNWSADQIAADLEQSAAILGAKEVVAYPFGHYNDTTKQGVAQAGFLLGRTIEWGYVTPGTDKFALPVIRINYGDTLESLISDIG